MTGRKVSGALLGGVAALLAAGYGTAQWLEWQNLGLVRPDGTPVDFFAYCDFMTRSIEFELAR